MLFKNLLIVLFLVLIPYTCFASISLPWSSTYDCPEWTQSDWEPVGCDGQEVYGGWTTIDGHEEQITSPANNPNGGGGRGQRSWYGPGTNNTSGGLRVIFSIPVSEFWIRYYLKYPTGFSWQNGAPHYDKLLYIDPGQSQYVVPEFYETEIGISLAYNSQNIFTTGSKGWPSIMGGNTGDGQWHCYEWHIKSDTDNTDGIIQVWVDGVLLLDKHDVDYYSTNQLWHEIIFPSNQDNVANAQDMPIDIDDMEIRTDGYIGPIDTGASIVTDGTASISTNGTASIVTQ